MRDTLRSTAKRLGSVVLALFFVLLSGPRLLAQTGLAATTLSSPLNNQSRTVSLTSATGINVGDYLYMERELTQVRQITPTVQVQRGLGDGGTQAVAHRLSTKVIILPKPTAIGQAWVVLDPSGRCVPTNEPYLPKVNTKNGALWDCTAVDGTYYQWQAWSGEPNFPRVPRTVVAGIAYTVRSSDYVVALSTTGSGSGGTSVAVQTWTLPSHTGNTGRVLVLKDESGGVTATTYVAFNGTIDGAFNIAANALKTAYGGVTLYAGSGGWFTISCWAYGCR